jgi:hypothetical protein
MPLFEGDEIEKSESRAGQHTIAPEHLPQWLTTMPRAQFGREKRAQETNTAFPALMAQPASDGPLVNHSLISAARRVSNHTVRKAEAATMVGAQRQSTQGQSVGTCPRYRRISE